MADKITSWKYAEDTVLEDDILKVARARAEALGIECITPSVGAHLTMLVNATQAKSIVEVGTGSGVSSLYLLRGSETAVLATIDNEQEHTNAAKDTFKDAQIAANRLRVITGKATDVLGNLADGAYDLVFLDADRDSLEEQVASASKLLRIGGVLVIAHALWRDRVPDPAMRDEATTLYRDLLRGLQKNEDYFTSVLPIGDGLLVASKRP